MLFLSHSLCHIQTINMKYLGSVFMCIYGSIYEIYIWQRGRSICFLFGCALTRQTHILYQIDVYVNIYKYIYTSIIIRTFITNATSHYRCDEYIHRHHKHMTKRHGNCDAILHIIITWLMRYIAQIEKHAYAVYSEAAKKKSCELNNFEVDWVILWIYSPSGWMQQPQSNCFEVQSTE